MAQILDRAAKDAKPVAQLSHQHPFSEDDAYAIQKLSIEQRFERGEKLIGLKMGFTSRAKMEQMGVHDLIWGRLTDDMLISAGGDTPFGKYIHPRAEPEICFRVAKTIDKPLTLEACKAYIDAVAPATEIIDSRYENFKFSLEDVVADNCSSTGFVVGEWQSPEIDLSDLKIELIIDGETVQSGNSNAILGNPWESVMEASRCCNKYGQTIPAGSYLMAGAATSAVYLEPGQRVRTIVEKLGEVDFSLV